MPVHLIHATQAARQGDLARIKAWWNQQEQQDGPLRMVLRTAVDHGHDSIAEFLASRLKEKAEQGWEQTLLHSFSTAALKGSSQVCIALLPLITPLLDDLKTYRHPIHSAAEGGHASTLDLLLSLPMPQETLDSALIAAAAQGKTQSVARLLSVTSPQRRRSAALKAALYGRHVDTVHFLAPLSNVRMAFRDLLKRGNWAMMDEISPWLVRSDWELALTSAPADALPKTRSLTLQAVMAQAIQVSLQPKRRRL